jgi:hypothetical protein
MERVCRIRDKFCDYDGVFSDPEDDQVRGGPIR